MAGSSKERIVDAARAEFLEKGFQDRIEAREVTAAATAAHVSRSMESGRAVHSSLGNRARP